MNEKEFLIQHLQLSPSFSLGRRHQLWSPGRNRRLPRHQIEEDRTERQAHRPLPPRSWIHCPHCRTNRLIPPRCRNQMIEQQLRIEQQPPPFASWRLGLLPCWLRLWVSTEEERERVRNKCQPGRWTIHSFGLKSARGLILILILKRQKIWLRINILWLSRSYHF